MIRAKRTDTKVKSIELTHGVNFNCRDDMALGNLLNMRGFESQTQLIKAYRGNLHIHPVTRLAFLSFHSDDIRLVQGFRLMLSNQHLELDIDDSTSRRAVRSDDDIYVRKALKERICASDIVICMIGNGTAWRDWVDWELETAISNRVPICGVRLKNSRGRTPEIIKQVGAPVAPWGETALIIAAIEQGIARGI